MNASIGILVRCAGIILSEQRCRISGEVRQLRIVAGAHFGLFLKHCGVPVASVEGLDIIESIHGKNPHQGYGEQPENIVGNHLVGTFMANEEILDGSKDLIGTGKGVRKKVDSKVL